MMWREYVAQVIGTDRQMQVARRTGVDQTTISRWLSPNPTTLNITPRAVATFARGYGVPVLQAFVVAGFLTEEEADLKEVMPMQPSLSLVAARDLAAELHRRFLNGDVHD